MSYLLDTCALSENLHKHPDRGFAKWLEAQEADDLFISSISVGELQKGIALLPRSSRKSQLDRWFREELLPFFEDRTLAFGVAEALEWGRLFAECQANGVKPPVIDSQLAATARAHGLTLVTRNGRDFRELGVEWLNPWSAGPSGTGAL